MDKKKFISKTDHVLNSTVVFRILILTVILTFILIFFLKTFNSNKNLKIEDQELNYSKSIEKGKN